MEMETGEGGGGKGGSARRLSSPLPLSPFTCMWWHIFTDSISRKWRDAFAGWQNFGVIKAQIGGNCRQQGERVLSACIMESRDVTTFITAQADARCVREIRLIQRAPWKTALTSWRFDRCRIDMENFRANSNDCKNNIFMALVILLNTRERSQYESPARWIRSELRKFPVSVRRENISTSGTSTRFTGIIL